jgi:hypothetical protein
LRDVARVAEEEYMKITSQTMPVALIVLASIAVVTGCASPNNETPTRITLEDAPAVLDLSSVLPSDFVRLDEWQARDQGATKESLGLGADASDLEVFASESPFLLVYCFIRIVEDGAAQREATTGLSDDNSVRDVTATLVDFVVAHNGLDASEPRIAVSHPGIGTSASLAEGEVEIEDGALRFELLSFRSQDKRVFGSVHSWGPPGEWWESVLELGREIERRITGFDADNPIPKERSRR